MSGNRNIGGRLAEREAWRLVQGIGHFIADVVVPDLHHIAFVRSPYPYARIRSISVEAAQSSADVVGVVTGQMLGPSMVIRGKSEFLFPDRPVLPIDYVRFEGQAVAAVIAKSPHAARRATQMITVEYEPLSAVCDALAASRPDSAQVHPEFTSNVLITKLFNSGSVDSAFKESANTIRRQFRIARGIGQPVEGRGVLAKPDKSNGGLHLWLPSQIPYLVRGKLAELLGISETSIGMSLPDMGGGFGTKNGLGAEEAIVAWTALKYGKACRWLESQEEAILASSHGHDHHYDVEIAIDTAGKISAVVATILVDIGAYSHWPWTAALEPIQAAGSLLGPYKIQNYRCKVLGVTTHKAPIGPLRGVARPSATFVIERMMDEVAHSQSADPLQYRVGMVVQPEDFPYRSATKLVYQHGSYREALNRLAEIINYRNWRHEQQAARAVGRQIGIGFSCALELGGIGSAMPVAPGTDIRPGVEGVTVRMGLDGSVTVAASVPSIGQHPESMFVSIVQHELGVRPENVVVVRDDAAAASYSAGVFAGRGAVIVGGAVAEGTRALRSKILHISAHLLNVSVDNLRIEDGRVIAKTTDASLSFEDVANVAYLNAHRLPPSTEPGLAAVRFLDPKFGVFANCAHAAIVEVDLELFTVKLLRYAAVTDCGNILNKTTVTGQVLGGIAYGIGLALAEQLIYDDAGFLVFPRQSYYPVCRATDLPNVTFDFLRTPADSPTGVKPVGQSSTIAAPAAIANAVADALRPFSVFVNQLPITPHSLFAEKAEFERVSAANN